MPSTREIRTRIRSVKNIAKITNAMQLIAASKMRRAQDRVTQGREYSQRMAETVAHLYSALGSDSIEQIPLLRRRLPERTLVMLLTPNRGLAGALVSNVLRVFNEALTEATSDVQVLAVGKKGEQYVARVGGNLTSSFDSEDAPQVETARTLASYVISLYEDAQIDKVEIVHSAFVSTAVQAPRRITLLPVEINTANETAEHNVTNEDFIYEPSVDALTRHLLPRYVETQIYQALLEASASEHSARMVAMRNATDNANEITDELTLAYNKARQEYITAELLDIVGGASALEN